MRNTALLLSLLVLVIFAGCNNQSRDLVNPVIGNLSFVEKFGFEPDENTDNDLRVQTHLQYVERLLRNKDISRLPNELKKKRLQLLDYLHSYAAAGKFPKNYEYKNERKPCFIDKDQTICAVGYLVEKSAGRAAAEQINAVYKYDNIANMKSELLHAWIASSGLSQEECAMIQPTYGSYPGDGVDSRRVKPLYAVGSAVLMGANATFSTISVIDLAKGGTSKAAPVLGFLAGTTQVAMGAFGFGREQKLTDYNNEPMLTSQGKLSLYNIGVGSATIFLSSWNLIRQKKMAQKTTSWNIFSFPAGNNQAGVGLSYSKKF